ncbi:acyltransferase [Vibrio ponticus]|uniref:Acyltransferase n=1 Tax=Vibrio ponticus TaxID=265668 RepID=A0A3N3DUZ9_9VIBR|nr:1-acyl-sn-glycerol-3-phosphate acyltransferase [Vibrio ponticus]ROV58018.1 acyltransferase [Vibrio ponticus]
MFKSIFKACFKLNKWKVVSYPPADIKRCVMIGAPHTSNWDFVYSMAAYSYMGINNPRFTIKKEWLRFPFNLILSPLGAIAIDRSAKKPGEKRPSMVDEMVSFIEDSDEITVLVTPEATRSPVKRWKKGFYQVALKADVPILLGYLDYHKREAGIGKVIYPSGDLDKDLREIYDFYNQIHPKHPERFLKL